MIDDRFEGWVFAFVGPFVFLGKVANLVPTVLSPVFQYRVTVASDPSGVNVRREVFPILFFPMINQITVPNGHMMIPVDQSLTPMEREDLRTGITHCEDLMGRLRGASHELHLVENPVVTPG